MTIGGFSAHAGQTFLLEYALGVKETVKDIFLVHGEDKPAQMLSEVMVEAGLERPHYPTLHSTVEV